MGLRYSDFWHEPNQMGPGEAKYPMDCPPAAIGGMESGAPSISWKSKSESERSTHSLGLPPSPSAFRLLLQNPSPGNFERFRTSSEPCENRLQSRLRPPAHVEPPWEPSSFPALPGR